MSDDDDSSDDPGARQAPRRTIMQRLVDWLKRFPWM